MKRHVLRRTMLVACVLGATSAHADVTKQECVDANTKAQSLQRDGKLRASRDALLICASASCPAIVKDDCTQQLDALNRKLPSILFEVKDGEGNDVSAVAITMDGQPLTDHVGVAAIPMDPGDHTFTFEMEGAERVEKRFLLREGEKDRHERVVLTRSATTSAPPKEHVEVIPAHQRHETKTSDATKIKFESAETDHPWSLRSKDGEKLCELPCTWDIDTTTSLHLRDERNTERTLDLHAISTTLKDYGFASGDSVTASVEQPSWVVPVVLLIAGGIGGAITAGLTLGPLAASLNQVSQPGFNGAYAGTSILGSLSVMAFSTGMFLALDNAFTDPRVTYAINGREVVTVGGGSGSGSTIAIIVGISFFVASTIAFGVAGSQLGEKPTTGCGSTCTGTDAAFRTIDFATSLADAGLPLFILGIQHKVRGPASPASKTTTLHIMPTPLGIAGSF